MPTRKRRGLSPIPEEGSDEDADEDRVEDVDEDRAEDADEDRVEDAATALVQVGPVRLPNINGLT